MGWSCRADAGDVMADMTAACRRAGDGSSNVYQDARGARYFWEVSRTEHRDGAITGTIWRFLPDGEHVRRAGSFRIDGDGTIARMPAPLRALLEAYRAEMGARCSDCRGAGRFIVCEVGGGRGEAQCVACKGRGRTGGRAAEVARAA